MSRCLSAVAVVSVASLCLAAVAAGAVTQRPSSGQCVGAWNRHAPSALRSMVVTARAWQGTVDETTVSIGTQSVRRTPGATIRTVATVPGCVFVFFLPGLASMTVSGVWRQGRIARWLPPIRHAGLTGSGNACVSTDATIHHVGAFTANSRCRRS